MNLIYMHTFSYTTKNIRYLEKLKTINIVIF